MNRSAIFRNSSSPAFLLFLFIFVFFGNLTQIVNAQESNSPPTLEQIGNPQWQLEQGKQCLEKKDPKNLALAIRYLKLAAQNGEPEAQVLYGHLFFFGRGTPLDQREALHWYLQAAQQGNPEGQFQLAIYHLHKLAFLENFNEARHWLKLSADQGFVPAMIYLGFIEQESWGKYCSGKEAREWLRKAASAGHGASQYLLGYLLAWGSHPDRNPIEAYYWFRRSAISGIDQAEAACRELAPEIPVKELERILIDAGNSSPASQPFSFAERYFPCFPKPVCSSSSANVQVREGRLVGYKKLLWDSEWVIPPIFEEIQNWKAGEQFTPARINGRWGMIDENGEWGLPPIYTYIRGFSQGMAATRIYNLGFGYLNASGQYLLPPHFDSAGDFLFGLAPVSHRNHTTRNLSTGKLDEDLNQFGRWGFIKPSGQVVIPFGTILSELPPSFNGFEVETSRPDDLIPFSLLRDIVSSEERPPLPSEWATEALVIPARVPESVPDQDLISDHSNLPAIAERSPNSLSDQDWIWTFSNVLVDRWSGIPVLRVEGNPVPPVREGLCPTYIEKDRKRIFGFIDRNGCFVIPPRYDEAKSFSCGLAPVRVGEAWGYIDRTGKMAIPPKFSAAGEFSENLAAVKDSSSRIGFINTRGRLIVPHKFIYAGDFHEGLAFFQIQNWKTGFIHPDGKVAIPDNFEFAGSFKDGLAPVQMPYGPDRRQGKWGFIDRSGKMVVSPRFSGAGGSDRYYFNEEIRFSDGLIPVKKNGFWGYANRDGTIIIPCRYVKASPFRSGFAEVETITRKFFINKLGHIQVREKLLPELRILAGLASETSTITNNISSPNSEN